MVLKSLGIFCIYNFCTLIIQLCKYSFLYLETKYFQYHIKLGTRCPLDITHLRLFMGYLYGQFPEVKPAPNLPMFQANSSSSPSDPTQMVKLFAKLWDQVSWMFLVLKKKTMIFPIDIILSSVFFFF